MPKIKPRRKALKGDQLTEALEGELATYEKVGLFQRSVTKRTAYRYRGVLLQYQKALNGATPSPGASMAFLAHLRQQGFSPASLRLYRAALLGFHSWRGEQLVFPIRLPHHLPQYIEPAIIAKTLELSAANPRDHLILRLMTDAGFRRSEVVNLRSRQVGERALRIRSKGSRDRTVPLTAELTKAIKPFCQGDLVLGVGEGVIYRVVKHYGKLAGKPELKPHDLRGAFATRLLEQGTNLRVVQELLGHSSVSTTQVYTQVAGAHLEKAIHRLNGVKPQGETPGTFTVSLPLPVKNQSPEEQKEARELEDKLFLGKRDVIVSAEAHYD